MHPVWEHSETSCLIATLVALIDPICQRNHRKNCLHTSCLIVRSTLISAFKLLRSIFVVSETPTSTLLLNSTMSPCFNYSLCCGVLKRANLMRVQSDCPSHSISWLHSCSLCTKGFSVLIWMLSWQPRVAFPFSDFWDAENLLPHQLISMIHLVSPGAILPLTIPMNHTLRKWKFD